MGRVVELALEPAQEGAAAHGREVDQLLERMHLPVVFEDEIAEVERPADDRVEEPGDLLLAVKPAQIEKELPVFHLVQVRAAHAVLQAEDEQVEEGGERIPDLGGAEIVAQLPAQRVIALQHEPVAAALGFLEGHVQQPDPCERPSAERRRTRYEDHLAGREVAARELVAVERAAPFQQDQQVVPPPGVEPFRFAGFELFVDEAAPDVGPVVVAGLVFAYI